MTSPYRDQSLRELIRELSRQVDELECGFTPFFWSRVAPELGLGGRWDRPSPGPDATQADLADVRQALDRRLDELRGVLARMPELETEWLEPPSDVVAVDVPSSALGRLYAALSVSLDVSTETQVLAVLRKSMRKTQLVSQDVAHRRAVLEAKGLHVSLRWVRNVSLVVDGWDLTLATAVARAAGSFAVRSRSGFEAIASEPLRRENGDEFDDNYRIEGDQDAARFALSEAVKDALIELTNKIDNPTLVVAAPTAKLSWTANPRLRLGLDFALEVLRALRVTLDGLELRRAGR